MKPEMLVRRTLHGLGYRFRLHGKGMPGRPDIVFSGRKKVIFIHGCFWHQHEKEKCLDGRRPKSNTGYWDQKLERNVARDASNIVQLEGMGWSTLTLWECELKDHSALVADLTAFLGGTRLSARPGP